MAKFGRVEGQLEQVNDRLIFTLFGFGVAVLAGIVGILVKLFLGAG